MKWTSSTYWVASLCQPYISFSISHTVCHRSYREHTIISCNSLSVRMAKFFSRYVLISTVFSCRGWPSGPITKTLNHSGSLRYVMSLSLYLNDLEGRVASAKQQAIHFLKSSLWRLSSYLLVIDWIMERSSLTVDMLFLRVREHTTSTSWNYTLKKFRGLCILWYVYEINCVAECSQWGAFTTDAHRVDIERLVLFKQVKFTNRCFRHFALSVCNYQNVCPWVDVSSAVSVLHHLIERCTSSCMPRKHEVDEVLFICFVRLDGYALINACIK